MTKRSSLFPMSKLHSYGFLSLLYSISDNPLGLWSKHVSSDGRIRRVEDESLNGDRVIEISGPDNSPISTCISCPANPEDCLNIQLPVLVIVIKNLKSRVQIAFQLIDGENIRRKFILSTSDNGKATGLAIETARLPLKLDEGWNLLEINLRNLCQSTYLTEYKALQRLIIYPNCRVRRVYLQDRHYDHNETPLQLCQAFFDMYMLKWGIHFVEKSCQTSETCKEIINVSQEATPFSNSESPLQSAEKLLVLRDVSPIKRPARKRLFSTADNSVKDENNKKSSRTERSIKKRVTGEDRKGSSFSGIASTPMKTVSDREGEIFRKWPYSYVKLRQIAQKKSVDSAKTRTIGSASAARDPIIVKSLGSVSPDRKCTGFTRLAIASTGLSVVPSEVEAASAEATKDLESTKSKLLTTDEAVGDFLELRHVINRKMLENFRLRGLTMTEVELSIYNSKHRKNSYGQGKLVNKHRTSVDKACHVSPSTNTIENKRKKSAAR